MRAAFALALAVGCSDSHELVTLVASDTRGTEPEVGADVTVEGDVALEGDVSGAELPDPPKDVAAPAIDVPVGTCGATHVLGCGESAEVALGGAGQGFPGCSVVPEPLGGAPTWLAVVPSPGGVASVRLASDNTAHQSAQLHAFGGCTPEACGCADGACTAVVAETRVSGAPLFLAVDDWLGADGVATVSVSCCAPDCAGRACGSDGCGGTCGECAAGCTQDGQCPPCTDCTCVPDCAGRACGPDGCGGTCGACETGGCSTEGQCLAPGGGGEACASAVTISALPWEGVYPAGATDDLTSSPDQDAATVAREGCLRSAAGGRDRVFRFQAPKAGVVEAWLEGASDAPCGASGGAPCPPALLHLTRACPFAECVASGDFLSPAAPRLRASVGAGEHLYLVVDGYDGADLGQFHLRVSWSD